MRISRHVTTVTENVAVTKTANCGAICQTPQNSATASITPIRLAKLNCQGDEQLWAEDDVTEEPCIILDLR